jgi:hypothetical protein
MKAIGDEALCQAIDRAERCLIDADLGGGLIKQRVARRGQGRRGGYRVIVAYGAADPAVFLHGFPKNARSNVSTKELKAMKYAAGVIMGMGAQAMASTIESGVWIEVRCDGKES